MPIQLTCAGCGKEYTVPDAWAGKRAKCPKCGAQVDIPAFVVEPEPARPAVSPLDEALGGELTGGDPLSDAFAEVSAPAASGGPFGPALPSKKRKRPKASGEPSIAEMLLALVRTQKLLTAVVAGMGLVLLWQLYLLVAFGFRVALLIVGGILLVAGVVIVIGGLRGTRRRDRATDAARATRLVGWFIIGVLGMVAAFGAGVVVGKINVQYIPAAVRITTPFFVVFGLITLVSGMVLAYYVLILLFPRANVFKIAGWGYVGLTIGVPLLGLSGLTLGLMLKQGGSESEPVAERFDEPESRITKDPLAGLRQKPPESPLGRPDSSRGRPQSSRERPEPSPRSEPRGQTDPPSKTQPSGQPSGSQPSGPPAHPHGPPPEFQRQIDEARARSLQFRMQGLVDKYGAERVVQINIEGAPMSKFGALVRHIRSIAGTQEHQGSMSGGRMWIAMGPVDDVHALAAKLDFGQVTVDAAARTITITADPGKLP